MTDSFDLEQSARETEHTELLERLSSDVVALVLLADLSRSQRVAKMVIEQHCTIRDAEDATRDDDNERFFRGLSARLSQLLSHCDAPGF